MTNHQHRFIWLLAALAAPALMGGKGGCDGAIMMGELAAGAAGTSGTSTDLGAAGTPTSASTSTPVDPPEIPSSASTSTPSDPPPAPEVALNPVNWTTETIQLQASDFELVVDGQRYYANASDLQVHSDPGDATYTSLELTWHEYGREMRLFMYLHADDTHWWSKEIRTYDGQARAEWIYYYGNFFNMPSGQPFTGNFTLTNNGPADVVDGTLKFKNLVLTPHFRK